jgi:hypothetical protein
MRQEKAHHCDSYMAMGGLSNFDGGKLLSEKDIK